MEFMTKTHRIKMLRIALLLAAALAVGSPAVESGSSCAVVVHASVSIDNIAFADLRRIFLGDKQFWEANNQRITILMRAPGAPERSVALEKIYQMSEAQFKQYWIAKVFRAEATSGPKIAPSNEMACNLIRAIPGSIALVSSAEVPAGFKVVKVDGRKPGESGYALTY